MNEDSPGPSSGTIDSRIGDCENCGRAIDSSTWTPTAVDHGDDAVRIVHFCTRECRREWKD